MGLCCTTRACHHSTRRIVRDIRDVHDVRVFVGDVLYVMCGRYCT